MAIRINNGLFYQKVSSLLFSCTLRSRMSLQKKILILTIALVTCQCMLFVRRLHSLLLRLEESFQMNLFKIVLTFIYNLSLEFWFFLDIISQMSVRRGNSLSLSTSLFLLIYPAVAKLYLYKIISCNVMFI